MYTFASYRLQQYFLKVSKENCTTKEKIGSNYIIYNDTKQCKNSFVNLCSSRIVGELEYLNYIDQEFFYFHKDADRKRVKDNIQYCQTVITKLT